MTPIFPNRPALLFSEGEAYQSYRLHLPVDLEDVEWDFVFKVDGVSQTFHLGSLRGALQETGRMEKLRSELEFQVGWNEERYLPWLALEIKRVDGTRMLLCKQPLVSPLPDELKIKVWPETIRQSKSLKVGQRQKLFTICSSTTPYWEGEMDLLRVGPSTGAGNRKNGKEQSRNDGIVG